jgi:hypothetical protein
MLSEARAKLFYSWYFLKRASHLFYPIRATLRDINFLAVLHALHTAHFLLSEFSLILNNRIYYYYSARKMPLNNFIILTPRAFITLNFI